MDVHEDPERNLVTATFELPGLTKEKVNIDVQNGNLTVFGEVTESAERNEHGYTIRERRTGRFSRSVRLPEGTQVGTRVSFPLSGKLWTDGCGLSLRISKLVWKTES